MKTKILTFLIMLITILPCVYGEPNPDYRNNQARVYVYDAGDDVTILKNNFIWIYASTGYVDSDSGTSTDDIFVGLAANSASYDAADARYKLDCWTYGIYYPAATKWNSDAANTSGKAGAKVYWDTGTYTVTSGVQTAFLTLDADGGSNRPIGYIERVVTAASKLYRIKFISDFLNTSMTSGNAVVCALLDVTPTTEADAIDINLTSNNFTKSSAIDIDAGDIVGKSGGNLLAIDFTQASTLTNDLSIIRIDGGTNVTFNTATVNYRGLEIDLSSATDTDFADFYGGYIVMPSSYQGTDPTAAIYATGAGLVSGLCYGTSTYSALFGTGSTSDSANALIVLSATKNTALTTAASSNAAVTNYVAQFALTNTNADDGGYDITCAANAVEIDYTCANTANTAATADTLSGSALDITITASVQDDANSIATSSAKGIFIDYNLTEAGAGTLNVNAHSVIDIDYDTTGTPDFAAGTYNLFKIDYDDTNTPTWAATSYFNTMFIDISGAKVTDGDLHVRGLNIVLPSTNGDAVTTGILIAGGASDNDIQAAGIIKADMFAQDRYYWCDDFNEEAAGVTVNAGLRTDEWVEGGTNSSADDYTYLSGPGGEVQLETDGAADDSEFLTHLPIIRVDKNPIIEFRFKTDDVVASHVAVLCGFVETAGFVDKDNKAAQTDDYILVGFDSENGHGFGATNIFCVTNDNGAGEDNDDCGVTISANTYVTVRIDCTDTEQPRIWVDNAGGAIDPSDEIDPSVISGTIQAGITYLPIIFVQGIDAAAEKVIVDYIKVWQDR